MRAATVGLVGLVAAVGWLLRPVRRDAHAWPPLDLEPEPVAGFGSADVIWVDPDGQRRGGTVLVACTDDQIARGLVGRRDLAGHDAMLLWLPAAEAMPLHMAGCPLPLTAVLFDDDGRWVSTLDLDPGDVDDTTVYGDGVRWRFCLEVPRGADVGLGLGPGCRLDLGSLSAS